MTINDLVSEFRITYDLGGSGLPGFEDDEIKQLLEINQYKLISQKLGGNNVYQSKYPDTNKRIDDLQGLITEASSTYYIGETPAGFRVDYPLSSGRVIIITLPHNYLHLIPDGISITDDSFTEIAKEIPISQMRRFSESRRNVLPYIKSPVFHFIESKLTVNPPLSSKTNRKIKLFINSDTGSDIVTNVKCLYVRIPENLTTTTDTLTSFNQDVYHELVAMTVDHAIDIASPNKSQISKLTLKQAE